MEGKGILMTGTGGRTGIIVVLESSEKSYFLLLNNEYLSNPRLLFLSKLPGNSSKFRTQLQKNNAFQVYTSCLLPVSS